MLLFMSHILALVHRQCAESVLSRLELFFSTTSNKILMLFIIILNGAYTGDIYDCRR